MKKCCECGKELKFWEGYCHPALGKKEIVCWNCHEAVEESMENYRNFILSDFEKQDQKKNEVISNIKSKFLNW